MGHHHARVARRPARVGRGALATRMTAGVAVLAALPACAGVPDPLTTAPPPHTSTSTYDLGHLAEQLLDDIRATEPTPEDLALFGDALAVSTWDIDATETAVYAARRYRQLHEMVSVARTVDPQWLATALAGAEAAHREALAAAPLVPLPDDFGDLEDHEADPAAPVSIYEDAITEMLAPLGVAVWIPRPGEATARERLVPIEPANEEDRTTLKTAIVDTMRQYGRLPQALVAAMPHTLVIADVVQTAWNGGVVAGYVSFPADGRLYLVIDGWYMTSVGEDGTTFHYPMGGADALVHEMGHVFQFTFGDGPEDPAFVRLYPSEDLPSPAAAVDLTGRLERQFEALDEVVSAPTRTLTDGVVVTTLENVRGDMTLLPENALVVEATNYNLYPGESVGGFQYFEAVFAEEVLAVPEPQGESMLAQIALRDARLAAGVSEAAAELLLASEVIAALRNEAYQAFEDPDVTDAQQMLLQEVLGGTAWFYLFGS